MEAALDDDWAVAKKERVGDGAKANDAVAGTSRRRIERRWPLVSPTFLAIVLLGYQLSPVLSSCVESEEFSR